MNDIGERIRELRRKKDMTQEKLADSLGVSYQAVSKWETGVACPDLSLIVPLARLFHISTDELLGYKDRRAELENLWQKALRLGEHETLKVSKTALKEYPHDETFLYRRACDEYICAEKITNEAQKRVYLERSVQHFKMLIAEYPDFHCAVGMLVQALSKLKLYDEAKEYAQNQPDKDRLLKYCLTGEELHKHCQKLIDQELQKLINEMVQYNNLDSLQVAENIINAIFSDGNYLYYYGNLMFLYYRRAELLVEKNLYDEAVEALRKSLQYTKDHKSLEGKRILPFTVPIFNKLTYNTNKIIEFNLIEGFHMSIKTKEFDALRDRSDFIALTREE